MELKDKKIYFIPSPHINYYHSYRGDSLGEDGFGMDIRTLAKILEQLDSIENQGLCNGITRMTWDYADLFWSIQLQKEYQADVLDQIIERCKKGKDEVLIGAWGNTGPPFLDTEEFHKDQEWFLKNSMGIGVEQLFPGRVAPYVRPQEDMFTQGMIEQYIKLGIKGFCAYYSVIPFDIGRPFINPPLDWNQQYGLVNFKSTVSDSSMFMIPMYSFGDALDYYSIKRWFELIRSKQANGDIEGHALLFLNFDMDADTWIGIKLPRIIQWMPNSRGMFELAEAVDMYDYVEFGNLLDVIPQLKIYGETSIKLDVGDGNFNGFYNWAQKYNNTKFWTVSQQARWLKCVSDTLSSNSNLLSRNTASQINKIIRGGDDLSDSYIKNKILLASTTNFGLAMPFLHQDRHKTAMVYATKALNAAGKAAELAVSEVVPQILKANDKSSYKIIICPLINRGISEKEIKNINSPILIKTSLPDALNREITKNNKSIRLEGNFEASPLCSVYENDSKIELESIIPETYFNKEGRFEANIILIDSKSYENEINEVFASSILLKNKHISLKFNNDGKISSFLYENREFACPSFLESSIVYGKKSGKKYYSKKDKIIVERNGSDGFSASVVLISEFNILPNAKVFAKKRITIYKGIPKLFINVEMHLPKIIGKSAGIDWTSSVTESFDEKWREIMPCEVRAKIIEKNTPLRIWKHNFLGYTSYFDLDMREVDPKNKNIDCLVNNISDGWMALTNQEKGILIGFNSVKAANFAFSPIKLRDKGFSDIKEKKQQIRINPFGTYFGKILHYWTEGSGHAQKFVSTLTTTYLPNASTYSGNQVSFDLIIIPYMGDKPPESIVSFADHFSLPPLIIIGRNEEPLIVENYKKYSTIAKKIIKDKEIEDIMDMSYLDWVRLVNKDFDPNKTPVIHPGLKLKIGTALKLFRDGLKGR